MKGLYLTFATWYQTGSNGNGHEKPWPYWLELVLRYEWPVFIGLFLCLACQFFRNFVIRYLAIYGVGIFAAYSIIHYKTPWIIISVVWPLLFVFAAGAAALKIPRKAFYMVGLAVIGFRLRSAASAISSSPRRCARPVPGEPTCAKPSRLRSRRHAPVPSAERLACACSRRRVVFAFLGGGLGLLLGKSSKLSDGVMRGVQRGAVGLSLLMSFGMAIWLNYFRCSTDSEPYVYVQTYNDIYKLMNPVMRLVRSNPLNYRIVGHFIRTSTYPFPWLLGDFPECGLLRTQQFPG